MYVIYIILTVNILRYVLHHTNSITLPTYIYVYVSELHHGNIGMCIIMLNIQKYIYNPTYAYI